MKARDDQFSMNHMNVLLQSLYNSCPLRNAIFGNDHQPEDQQIDFDSSNSLKLIFAKMHYDIENHRNPTLTDASIYFKDSYLKAVEGNDPINFYSWITRELFEFPKYRKLLQWDILTTKKTSENESEVFIEDQFDVLSIQPRTFQSIQSFLDDFFETKIEEVVVTSDGESHEKSLIIIKEFVNSPSIATFLIDRQNEFDFNVEETIRLSLIGGEKKYKLNSLILFDDDGDDADGDNGDGDKYSVCLKASDSFWYKIQDDSYAKISQELLISLASKFGYMLFYLDTEFEASSCSPKPSQELIMDSLTKNTIHTISKTVQKQSNSPSLRPLSLSIKTKDMSANQLTFSSPNAASPSILDSPSLLLNLSNFPLMKTPSIVELAQLEAILVPADLSNVKMNLIKTDQSEPVAKGSSESIVVEEEEEGEEENRNSFEDFGVFAGNLKADQDEIELDYFKEIDLPQHKSRSSSDIWSQRYLKQNYPASHKSEHRRDLFAGLLDFEMNFHESQATSVSRSLNSHGKGEDEDEEEELFMKATLAKIHKSRGDEGKVEELSGKQMKLKKKNKKSASKIQQDRSMVSDGLFNRPQKSTTIPLTKLPIETEQSEAKDEADHKTNETEHVANQKESKRINRYAKF